MITMITTLSHIHSPAPNDFVGGCFMCPDSLEVVSCAQSRGRGTEGEGGLGVYKHLTQLSFAHNTSRSVALGRGGGAASGARGRGEGGGFGGEGGDCQGCRVLALDLRVLPPNSTCIPCPGVCADCSIFARRQKHADRRLYPNAKATAKPKPKAKPKAAAKSTAKPPGTVCPFFQKTGSCRKGANCDMVHSLLAGQGQALPANWGPPSGASMINPFAAFSIQIGSAGVQAGLPAADPKGAVRERPCSQEGRERPFLGA